MNYVRYKITYIKKGKEHQDEGVLPAHFNSPISENYVLYTETGFKYILKVTVLKIEEVKNYS